MILYFITLHAQYLSLLFPYFEIDYLPFVNHFQMRNIILFFIACTTVIDLSAQKSTSSKVDVVKDDAVLSIQSGYTLYKNMYL